MKRSYLKKTLGLSKKTGMFLHFGYFAVPLQQG